MGISPETLNGVYGATKAYVLALSHSLQHEVGDKGVRVQAVLPGATATASIKKYDDLRARTNSAYRVARAVRSSDRDDEQDYGENAAETKTPSHRVGQRIRRDPNERTDKCKPLP